MNQFTIHWIFILLLPRWNINFMIFMIDSSMNNMCTFWWSESLRWGGRPMWLRLQLNPSPVKRKSTIAKWKNLCFHSIGATGFGRSSIEEYLRSKLYLESSKAENTRCKKCGKIALILFSNEDIILKWWLIILSTDLLTYSNEYQECEIFIRTSVFYGKHGREEN